MYIQNNFSLEQAIANVRLENFNIAFDKDFEILIEKSIAQKLTVSETIKIIIND